MRPMLDPARDLAGATPEKLARALLRNRLRPGAGGKPELNYATAKGVLILLPSTPAIAPLNQGQLTS